MPTESATATDWSRYAEQAATDLEEIRRRQHELTHQLESLHREENLLLSILNFAERPAPAPDPAHVEEQEPGETGPRPGVSAPAAVLSPATGSTAADEPGRTDTADTADTRKDTGKPGRSAARGRKAKARQVLLWELLLDLLQGHDEPCLAAELREELLRRHPDRRPSPQVVRNTLEALVAKGRIQRHKQQRSVMYTVAEPDGTGSPSGGGTPDDPA